MTPFWSAACWSCILAIIAIVSLVFGVAIKAQDPYDTNKPLQQLSGFAFALFGFSALSAWIVLFLAVVNTYWSTL